MKQVLQKRVRSAISLIWRNVELYLLFIKENIVEIKRYQTMLLHLFDKNRVAFIG